MRRAIESARTAREYTFGADEILDLLDADLGQTKLAVGVLFEPIGVAVAPLENAFLVRCKTGLRHTERLPFQLGLHS
ncbi:hypothetical protein [Vannielia litorea]|uniref:hypothetical protein n=1 Tax=Vannielia litorea TaxID=1217970 RepID=UPI001C94D581|nr:hypothetical protein [Vannielia litorea]MBY6048314.1 hypothetical protein [Vannielia litorea]MBY6075728.1 hypothetical protein [Vannielia litorea]